MIRVIYRWTVEPEQVEAFANAWWAKTRMIQENVPGARGSTLLRSQSEENVFIAVARWDSLAAWQAGRQPNPAEVSAAQPATVIESGVRRPTYEIFDEISDWPYAAEAPKITA